jgi:hypothetical protein
VTATSIKVAEGHAWAFEDPIYKCAVQLYCCPHAVMEAAIQRDMGVAVADGDNQPAGKVIELRADSGARTYVIWLLPPWREASLDDMNTLVHEVTHAALTALMRRGLNADVDHEEPYCYFLAWLFEVCLQLLRGRAAAPRRVRRKVRR